MNDSKCATAAWFEELEPQRPTGVWVRYISPTTGGLVEWKYPSEAQALRSLRHQGGAPDTHRFEVIGPAYGV